MSFFILVLFCNIFIKPSFAHKLKEERFWLKALSCAYKIQKLTKMYLIILSDDIIQQSYKELLFVGPRKKDNKMSNGGRYLYITVILSSYSVYQYD